MITKIRSAFLIPLLLLSWSSINYAHSEASSLIPVSRTFVPVGFDSNDNVEIFVKGYLPNLCYQTPQFKVKKRGTKIYVDVKAYYYPDQPYCPQVIVPFGLTVPVGRLDSQKYNIVINKNTEYETNESLVVGSARSENVDDYIYALVENIEVKDGKLILSGNNPSDCFALDDIEIISNGKNTYSVLPKLKKSTDDCPVKQEPFVYEKEFTNNLDTEKVLFHVRKMDGRAINQIVKIK
ncbi:MAG: hypothetical protein H6621_02555 [Halobacteriovoraceae bacterium]|nr:hypothetical protein [Halobacteriovoraceae bacterium]MCB9093924.1 hypothetical protein [Halobacteriovoraceae bacterium]